MIELLQRAAAEAPEQPAIVSPGRSESYRECLERSKAFAGGLSRLGIERFGCALEAPRDVLVALAGSSAVGSEACVYPRELDTPALNRLASTFEHRIVVTDSDQELDCARALAFDRLVFDTEPAAPVAPVARVLVLTTGTTGDPKGARHDWARLLDAVRHPDQRSGKRWLLAYNLNQFGGLQVLLHVLASRATLVVPASPQPADVIDAIRENAVTHVSATPTFWRLVTGSLNAERAARLPLEQITLGGEAVQEGLIERIRMLFPTARVSQIYGSTESGTAVSVNDGRSGLPLSTLERDESADVRLRIVDGELQMRSRVGMLGYYHGEETENEWRSTGDLVEVRGDRIHFVGRRTDIINVGGVKVTPFPIEELACTVDGVELVAVYGRPNALTGQIVAIDVVAAAGADTAILEERIRAACEALPRAARPRRIRFVDALELRGHKVLRRQHGAVA